MCKSYIGTFITDFIAQIKRRLPAIAAGTVQRNAGTVQRKDRTAEQAY